LFNWHRRIGHRSMKAIAGMAKAAVTGMALKDIPDDIPKLYSCASCALTKSRHFPYKDRRDRAAGADPWRPSWPDGRGVNRQMQVRMDDYSRAS